MTENGFEIQRDPCLRCEAKDACKDWNTRVEV